MRKTSTLSLLIILLIAAPALPVGRQQDKKAQQNQGDIKLTTELVQIDVLVSDKNNKPVGGLNREDFELYDNNKLQHVTNFSYEDTKAKPLAASATDARSLSRAIGAAELKRVIAFIVDTLHMKFENVAATRKILSDFVDSKMQPGDLVLILPTGGGSGVLQQFTSDPRLLRRAIGRLRPFYFTNATTPYRGLSPSSGMRGSLPGGNIDPFEAADARATLGALNETVKSMSKLPGRKVSVFVSEGFRLLATQTNRELNQTTALAARANVVFYTIDPRGLDPLVLNAADEIERGADLGASVTDTMNRKRADFFESQDTLNSIALDTGGKFFRNNNDIKRGLDSILEENSAYYMLGFYPEAGKWDGKYHKVKVVVRSRPDLIVSFRKGYLAKSPASEKASIDPAIAEALEAISSPLVRRDIDLRLTPLYLDDAKRDPIVTLLIHIDASKLNFSRAENRYKSKLIQIGFVLDASGKLADRFSDTIDLNLQQHTYESALKRGFVATRALNVKPGVYQIRLFVRDGASGLIGTANDYVEVPDLKSGRLATSSLFLSGRSVEQGKVVETAGAAGTPSQRRFQRTGEFSYSLVIYNAELNDSKQSQLEMKTRIVKGNQTVYNGELRPVEIANGSTPTRVVTGGVIKLSQLEPDDYTLQVTVRDKLRKKNNLVRTEMDFSVE